MKNTKNIYMKQLENGIKEFYEGDELLFTMYTSDSTKISPMVIINEDSIVTSAPTKEKLEELFEKLDIALHDTTYNELDQKVLDLENEIDRLNEELTYLKTLYYE